MRIFSLSKFAQIESFLSQKGFSQDLILYVQSLPQHVKKEVGGIVNRNPTITEDILRKQIENLPTAEPAMQPKRSNQPSAYRSESATPEEIEYAKNFQDESFAKWYLNTSKLYRNQKWQSTGIHGNVPYDRFVKNIPATLFLKYNYIYDWYVGSYLPAKKELGKSTDPQKFVEVSQKYSIPNPTIDFAKLSFDEAHYLSTIWHDSLAGKNTGAFYKDEKPSDIVYGPQWKNEKFNGWTIKKITTTNNLKTEGEKMDHCVGGEDYCADLLEKRKIIFSLRDPYNEPHVTMQARTNYEFIQIYGEANSDPKPEYKKAIGEWLKSLESFKMTPDDEYEEDLSYDSLSDDIESRLFRNYEDYGIENKPRNIDAETLYDEINQVLSHHNRYGRGRQNGGREMHPSAESYAKAILHQYKYFDLPYLRNENSVTVRALELARFDRKYDLPKQYDFMVLTTNLSYMNILQNYSTSDLKSIADAVRSLINQYGQKRVYQLYSERYLYHRNEELNTISKSLKEYAEILIEAYDKARAQRKYPNIEYLSELEANQQISYISRAIQEGTGIGEFYKIYGKNNSEFYQWFDHNYTFNYHVDEPESDDFESDEEYEAAHAEWESDKEEYEQKERDYLVAEARNENLPYCFDDSVLEVLESLARKDKPEIPQWIVDLYTSNKKTLPECLRVLQTNKKEASSVGWYIFVKTL